MSSGFNIESGNGKMKLMLDSVVKISPPQAIKNAKRDVKNGHQQNFVSIGDLTAYSQPKFSDVSENSDTLLKHLSNTLSPPLPRKGTFIKTSSTQSSHVNHSHTSEGFKDQNQPSYKYDHPRNVNHQLISPINVGYVNLIEKTEERTKKVSPPKNNFIIPRHLYVNEKTIKYDVPKIRNKPPQLQINTIPNIGLYVNENPKMDVKVPKVTLQNVIDLSTIYVDVNYQVVGSTNKTSNSPKKHETTQPEAKGSQDSIAKSLQYLDIVDIIPSRTSHKGHGSYQTLPHRLPSRPKDKSHLPDSHESHLSLYDSPRQHRSNDGKLTFKAEPIRTTTQIPKAFMKICQEEQLMKTLLKDSKFHSKSLNQVPGSLRVKEDPRLDGKDDRHKTSDSSSHSIICKVMKRITFHNYGSNSSLVIERENSQSRNGPTRSISLPSCCLLKRFRRKGMQQDRSTLAHPIGRGNSLKRQQKFNIGTKVLPSFTQFTKKKDKTGVKDQELNLKTDHAPPADRNDNIIKKIMGRLSYHEIDFEKTEALRRMMLSQGIN